MSILVLGGDGYLGWPLAIKLAHRHPKESVIIADNLCRRRLVQEVGSDSLTPIAGPAQRRAAFARISGHRNLEFTQVDVSQPALAGLVARVKPRLIYHAAQQASAPYSMMGLEQAMFTLTNNEVGNMRLLWAIREHVPDCHLVKLGSFGEYAKGGLDIAEGYFTPTYRGRQPARPIPFPRESDDIYHISKINDTNYISMACRKWGLRITDIMQSTIFGVAVEETTGHPELYTRLDYDGVFGTVANRFLTQAIAGHPITVYGSGWQRTGLMALEDALNSMVALADHPPERGEHKVINHVTEGGYCINEIADLIQTLAEARGLSVAIHRGEYDPRDESPGSKMAYEVETHYVTAHVTRTPVETVAAQTFDIALEFRDRIRPEAFPPRVTWGR